MYRKWFIIDKSLELDLLEGSPLLDLVEGLPDPEGWSVNWINYRHALVYSSCYIDNLKQFIARK